MALYLVKFNKSAGTFTIGSTEDKDAKVVSKAQVISVLQKGIPINGLAIANGKLILQSNEQKSSQATVARPASTTVNKPASKAKAVTPHYKVCALDYKHIALLDVNTKEVKVMDSYAKIKELLAKGIKVDGTRYEGNDLKVEIDSAIYNRLAGCADIDFYVGDAYYYGGRQIISKSGVRYSRDIKFDGKDCMILSYTEKLVGGCSRSYDGFRDYYAIVEKETFYPRKCSHVCGNGTDAVRTFSDGLYVNDARIVRWDEYLKDVRFEGLEIIETDDYYILIFTSSVDGKDDDGEYTDCYVSALKLGRDEKRAHWLARDKEVLGDKLVTLNKSGIETNGELIRNTDKIISILKAY